MLQALHLLWFHQTMFVLQKFYLSLLLLFQGFAPPHVINDIYQRIYTIDNKVDSMMNKFQADCSALQASFTRLDTLVTQMKSQIDILSGIYSNQNGDELVADVCFLFYKLNKHAFSEICF